MTGEYRRGLLLATKPAVGLCLDHAHRMRVAQEAAHRRERNVRFVVMPGMMALLYQNGNSVATVCERKDTAAMIGERLDSIPFRARPRAPLPDAIHHPAGCGRSGADQSRSQNWSC